MRKQKKRFRIQNKRKLHYQKKNRGLYSKCGFSVAVEPKDHEYNVKYSATVCYEETKVLVASLFVFSLQFRA